MALCMLFPNSTVHGGLWARRAVFFVGGLFMLCLGILGEYMGRVYDEVRSRPLSIISRIHSFSP